MDRIREIEIEIDNLHKNSPIFTVERSQAIFNTLRVFEDTCRVASLLVLLDGKEKVESFIHSQMDGLNIALKWIYEECPVLEDKISFTLGRDTYMQTANFMMNHAIPYSQICDGYIGFSRNFFMGRVSGNTVEFTTTDQRGKRAFYDIAETIYKKRDLHISQPPLPGDIKADFEKTIYIDDDGRIGYKIQTELYNYFKNTGIKQWDATRSLPSDWVFSEFTMEQYKKVWVTLFAIASIHCIACLSSGVDGCAVEDVVIVQDRNMILSCLSSLTGLDQCVVDNIITLLSFNVEIKNIDIMYQPLIEIGKQIIITPMLIMGSSPERNLISLLLKMKDKNLYNEVNSLESLMQKKLDEALSGVRQVRHRCDIKLPGDLPDIDYAIYDELSNAILICELKWLVDADSVQEVCSREFDIQHGCEQVDRIMGYAMCNKKDFVSRLFDLDDENVDYFYCVVAKNNIRYKEGVVPVIALERLVELIDKFSIGSVFHIIRNHEFYRELPKEFEACSTEITYDGYTFKIPAIGFAAK